MKQLVAVFALVSLSKSAFAFAPPKPGDKTKDVVAYASAHSEFTDQGFNRFDCAKCTTLKNAIFVTAVNSCGTGSCDYMLFEISGEEATYRTSIELKPGAFQFLKSTHNSLPDIKLYHHVSAYDGFIKTMQFNGQTYKVVGPQKKIAASQFDKEITPEKVMVTNSN